MATHGGDREPPAGRAEGRTSARPAFYLRNAPGLIGVTLHVQVLQVEASGAGFVFSSSNGVQMTVGQL